MKGKQIRRSRPVPGLSREDEEKQLKQIIDIAQKNLIRTEERVTDLSGELHELMETYGTKDKEALAMFHNTQSQLRESRRDLVRCRKARKKPYFGRIDFRDPHQPADESFYVGRVGISENTSNPVVIDWRAPLASVYYENNTGQCTYTVKNEGSFTIDLKRKRTYEIEDDQLKDFFDSDVVANDELLTKYLAKNKTAVLGEIIATIQKEQNAVIRRSPKMNLIVQGVAGSGKTTVAMHRISYILYNYEDEFRPEDFYIIGSNRILLNYITSVLPDLDVYGVSQMTMEQLFIRLLYEDWDSGKYLIRSIDKKDSAVCIKGGSAWFHDLEMFCQKYEAEHISLEDVRMEGNHIILLGSDSIRSYLENNPGVSMQGKINMLNEILMARLENELAGRYVSYPPDVQKELRRMYRWYFGRKEWKGSVFEVYGRFLEEQAEKGKAVPYVEGEFDLYDLSALAYLYKRIKETDGIREASHVIIDEAQDFGMMAYHTLAYCLRGCTYTIMGDVSQNIHFGYGLNDWEELRQLLLPPGSTGFCLLKKSYRNTVEISHFATEILRHGHFPIYPVEPVERHGSPVTVKTCPDEEAMLLETEKRIRKWLEDGRETIAVICRDEEEAAEVRDWLGTRLTLADSDPETANFTEGIMVLPVEYTKGLEFDAVLLYHPSSADYPAEDRYVKLLYVAATRALHELTVVHQGDLTDLIAKPVPDEKKPELLGSAEESEKQDGDEPGQEKIRVRQEKRMSDMVPGRGQTPAARSAAQKINPSPHHFGECPDVNILRLKDMPEMDCSIRTIRKTKRYLDLIGPSGTLRVTPIASDIIRIRFIRGSAIGSAVGSADGYWNLEPDHPVAWTARAGRDLAEAATDRIAVRIDRRTGALRFLDQNRKVLLAERQRIPRQIRRGAVSETWNHFDWQEKEKIYAKGFLKEDLERINRKARYINFGGKKMRMPLLLSDRGYGIGVAAEQTVICCMISMYGNYLYTDGTDQIDYYFLYGGSTSGTLELYKKIT